TVVGETTARLIPARAAAAEWMQMLQTDSLRPPRWSQVEALLGATSVPTSAGAARTDGVAHAFVAAFAGPDTASGAAWIVDRADLARGGPEPFVGNLSLVALARQFAAEGLPSRMSADTTSPRLAAFRRLAHAPMLPELWAYRAGLPGVRSTFAMPTLSADAMRAVGYANAVTGLVALSHGDTTTALLRSRENAGVAKQLLRQLLDADAATAAVLLTQAADLTRAVGTARN